MNFEENSLEGKVKVSSQPIRDPFSSADSPPGSRLHFTFLFTSPSFGEA